MSACQEVAPGSEMSEPTLSSLKAPPPATAGFSLSDWVDIQSGLMGAVLLGGVVLAINWSHGAPAAATAAGKQFVYTFFFGSLIMALTTRLAKVERSTALVLTLATIVPSVITTAAVFALHQMRGTPEPLLSAIPAAAIAPVSFFFWARRKRTLSVRGREELSDVEAPAAEQPL